MIVTSNGEGVMRRILQIAVLAAALSQGTTASAAEEGNCTDVTDTSHQIACNLNSVQDIFTTNRLRFERDYANHKLAVRGRLEYVGTDKVYILVAGTRSHNFYCLPGGADYPFLTDDAVEWKKNDLISITGEYSYHNGTTTLKTATPKESGKTVLSQRRNP